MSNEMEKTLDAIADAAKAESWKYHERLEQQFDAIAKMRMEFFDRIILLDGGTVALSVTLVGSFVSKSRLSALAPLIASWVAFLLSMLLGLTRNWIEHDRLAEAERNSWVFAVREYLEAEKNRVKAMAGESPEVPEVNDLQKVVDQAAAVFKTKRHEHKHESLRSWTKVVGIASLVCTLVGFSLLLVFAVKNILLLR
jgi:hypothetical protein